MRVQNYQDKLLYAYTSFFVLIMGAKTFSLSIPGFSIGCKAWGNPELPPMIAIHGWLDNANSFDQIAPFLEPHFYIIAIDLPGHGLSSHLPEGCFYHFIDGIFNVLKIINALGFNQVHLLGHSMGACLASLIGGIVPNQILSMILIEALGPFSSPEESCCEQLAKFQFQQAHLPRKKERPYPSMALAAEVRAANGHLTLKEARILCERGVREENNLFYWRHDRRLLNASPLKMTEKQIISCLTQIKAKSCLIWGEDGFSFGEELVHEREKAVSDLTIYRLQGGHHLHMENPEKVAECIYAFYDIKV